MKKFLAALLLLTLTLTMFVACGEDPVTGPTLDDAVEYLVSTYKSHEGKKTPVNYKLIAQVPIDDVSFSVTWTVDHAGITITANGGLYDVILPANNDTETTYTLTATIKDASGNSKTKTFTRVLPVYSNESVITAPVAGEAYKLFMEQAKISGGVTLFAVNTTASDNKYINSTLDPKEAADYYVEVVEGGYKFYTTIGDVKNYVYAHITVKEDGKVSKYLGLSATDSSVWVYKQEVNAWYTVIDTNGANIEYAAGTYNTYDTFGISELSYFSAENTGISQFPLSLMKKSVAEEMAPDVLSPIPTTLTSIKDFNAIASALAAGASSAEKYLIKGTITEVQNATYGNVILTDEAGDSILVYGLYDKDGSNRYDKLDYVPVVGDTITVAGVAMNYNDTKNEMVDGWIQAIEKGNGEGGGSTTTMTPEEIVNAAWALETDTTLENGPYTLTGVITEIGDAYNTQYKNVTITIVVNNMTDKPIVCFRLKGTGADVIKVGDTVTVKGDLMNYAGTIEFNSGCTLESYTAGGEGGEGGEGGGSTPAPVDPIEVTFEEFNAIASAQPDKGDATTQKYILTGKIVEIKSTKYGNMYIEDANGVRVYIYGFYSADGTVRYDAMEVKPVVGDTVTVVGVAGNYNGAQMANAAMTAHTPHTHVYTTLANKCDVCGAISDHTCVDADANNACDLCDEFVASEGTTVEYSRTEAIAVGDIIVLAYVNGDAKWELTGWNNNIGIASTFDTVVSGTYALEVVAGASEGTVAFKTPDGKYLAYNVSGNKVGIADSVDATASWTVTFDADGRAVITNAATAERVLQFNSNAGQERFCCYKGTQVSVDLYKKNV